MRNWIKGLGIALLALGLAACSNPAEVQRGSDESKKSDLTVAEVFEKAQAASEKLESMHAEMNINQKSSSAELGIDVDSKIKLNMDMVLDPLETYQAVDIDMGELGKETLELYMTKEGYFMLEPERKVWMKLPEEMHEAVAATTSSADPTLDWSAFEKFVEDFTFEQNDDAYILKLKAAGDKFNSLIQEQLANVDGLGEVGAEVMEGIKIDQLDYEIFIDKKTFQTIAFDVKMNMEMEIESEKVEIVQNMRAKISAINELKDIKVPQDILDSAVGQ